MRVSVDWLKDYVKVKPPVEKVAERLTMAGLEVKKIEPSSAGKDSILELEITSNRPDWLSHIGVAREIAAVDNLSLKIPPVAPVANRPMPPGWRIHLKNAQDCPYYSGVLLEGVEWNETPDFIRERLHAVGIRAVNLIVDITNYVLLETGQPLHAFDADLMQGKEIQVRSARAGEKMTAINGTLLQLSDKDLVIADRERAVALAGVMGGMETEVTGKTRNIFLESAFFLPASIRRTSRRYGLMSDSSYRFERRVDPEGVDFGRERAVHLIQQYAKPRFTGGVLKAGHRPVSAKRRIHFRACDLEKILGVKIKAHEIVSILTRLGLGIARVSAEAWNITSPSFRPDITGAVDLMEEVARLYGYDKIPETLPAQAPITVNENPLRNLEEKTRHFFAGAGLQETVTFSLISGKGLTAVESDKAVTIVNPQNKELVFLRPTLLPSLLEVIVRNSRLGARSVSLFEIASLYMRQRAQTQLAEPLGRSGHSLEERTVGFALFGALNLSSWLDTERKVTFFDLKGLVETYLEKMGVQGATFLRSDSPIFEKSRAESIQIQSVGIGLIGQVHHSLLRGADLDSEVYFGELSIEKLSSHARKLRKIAAYSHYPSVDRDLSVVVPESIRAAEIKRLVEELGVGLVRRVELFDLFRGGRIPKGCKNLGFRVIYQSDKKTLVSEDIQQLHSEIAEAVAKQFQATFQ